MPEIEQVTVDERPLAERLHPEGPFHQKLLSRLRARRHLAEKHIQRRYDAWDQTDEHVRLFVDLARKAKKADQSEHPTKKEVPFERAIVVPASFAILQVRLTQLLSIFGSRTPEIQYEGRAPEDVRAAKLMETVVGYDLQQMPAILVFYALFQDAEKYGMGVTYDVWDEEPGWVYEYPPLLQMLQGPMRQFFLALMQRFGVTPRPVRKWGVRRQRNLWMPVDPFHFWPDPRVPVSQVQSGEFVGHRVFRGKTYLLERSVENGGVYFNTEFLDKFQSQKETRATSRNRFALQEFSLETSADEKDRGFFGLDHLQVKLVPREWELAEESKPQIWWFTWSNDALIVRAHSAPFEHGEFTYTVGESVPDEHALFNPGMVENMDGLQRFMTWLLSSHLENVQKHLNDALIYCPTFVEEADILNPGPAKHYRLTKAGEALVARGGHTMESFVHQLQLQDVTGSHLNTIRVLFDMMQRMAATSDPQMGQTTQDKRTLGEVQQILASSSQRLAVTARLLDAMAIRPLAYRAIANRQQFTSQEQYFRVAGDLAREVGGAQQMLIRPVDLQGNFDYIPHSGAVPQDPARFTGVWIKMAEALARFPILLQPGADGKAIDPREIFNETFRTMGVKNVSQFYVQVVPDQQMQAAVQAGNAVPVGADTGGAGLRTPVVPAGIDLRGANGG